MTTAALTPDRIDSLVGLAPWLEEHTSLIAAAHAADDLGATIEPATHGDGGLTACLPLHGTASRRVNVWLDDEDVCIAAFDKYTLTAMARFSGDVPHAVVIATVNAYLS